LAGLCLLLAGLWASESSSQMMPGGLPRATSASRPASHPTTTSGPTTAAAAVTKQQFMNVMNQSCVRCHHNQCGSVEGADRANWLVPGHPEQSRLYTIIGAGRGVHNLSDANKKIVHDFISQMKS
jgi:mono/diheme cytochrome c family protein